MLNFKTIRWRNFLSTGNQFNEIRLDTGKQTLIVGGNGNGKCLDKNTEIEIQFDNIEIEQMYMNFLTKPI